jgi:hypothetical protein
MTVKMSLEIVPLIKFWLNLSFASLIISEKVRETVSNEKAAQPYRDISNDGSSPTICRNTPSA